MKNIFGVLLIFCGIFAGLYLNVYCLITGIIDIVQGNGSLVWNIFKIAFRELIGAVVAITFIGLGFALMSKSIGKFFGKTNKF